MINVSVIIPHYNAAHWIGTLLNSIPKRNDFQVIVVDDNSTKDIELLNKVIQRDGRCEFYRNNLTPYSAGAARNVGIKYAKGEWLLFADSDDYFTKDFDKVIEPYFQSDADIIYFLPKRDVNVSGFSDLNAHYQSLIMDYTRIGDRYSELALRYSFAMPGFKLIRHSVILANNIWFDEARWANDVMFSAKIGHYVNKISVSEEVIYCTTRQETGLYRNHSEETFNVRRSIRINRYMFLRKNLSKQDMKLLDHSLYGDARIAFKRFGLKKAWHVFYESFKYQGIYIPPYFRRFVYNRKRKTAYGGYRKLGINK